MSAKKAAEAFSELKGVILTRQAAKILNCSQGHVRNLVLTGKLRAAKLGDRAMAFYESEVRAYAESQAKARAAGTARGPAPLGFQPDE